MTKKKKELNRYNPKTSSTSITDLPYNFLTEIFSRVPAQTIFACRCVCKSWLFLTSNDSYFASLHFSRSPIELMVRPKNYGTVSWSRTVFLVDFEFDNIRGCYGDKVNFRHKFILPERYPDNYHDHEYNVVSSCNGLLCLCKPSYRDSCIVCNPITGEYAVLPKPKDNVNVKSVILSVFGFSPSSNQYKVLRVLCVCNGELEGYRMAEILVVGSDLWRCVWYAPLSPTTWSGASYTSYLNGTAHWACDDDESLDFIASFGFESERFGKVLPPSLFGETHKKNKRKMGIGVLEGFLFICDVTPSGQLDIWVMKDYGLQESWSIYFVVDTTAAPILHLGRYGLIKFLSNGEILMVSVDSYLVCYDPMKKNFRYLSLSDKNQTIFHTPSFVSLKDVVMGDNLMVLNVKSR